MIMRIKNSWLLLERSLVVLSQNKKLLVFPIVTFFATLFIVFFFLGSFLLQPTGHGYTEKAHWTSVAQSVFTKESLDQLTTKQTEEQPRNTRNQLALNRTGMACAAALYFLSMFLATFFNVAFYHEILEALQGRPVSLRQGFKFAISKLKPILMWSLFAGLVGYLIKSLEERMGLFGRIMVRLIGLAWSVASVFAIPIIICKEDAVNPMTVLKTSAMTLKQAWGETLAGFVGLSAGRVLVFLGSMIPFGIAFIAGIYLNQPAIIFGSLLAWMMFIVVFGYLAGVASNVYQCALYLYASSGTVPSSYSPEMMNLAWKFKKK